MSGDQEDHDRRFAVQRGEIMLRDIMHPDIVKRLRGYRYDGRLLRDAADEIERLRARDAGVIGAISVGDRVRITTPPWVGDLGTIEHIDGAYHDVRRDASEHPDDVLELYPCEFEAADE